MIMGMKVQWAVPVIVSILILGVIGSQEAWAPKIAPDVEPQEAIIDPSEVLRGTTAVTITDNQERFMVVMKWYSLMGLETKP